ncbi:C-type lectin domain family 2 member D isoform X2 [Prionailurus iriomotensis]
MDDGLSLGNSDFQSKGDIITFNLTNKPQGPSKRNKERLCICKVVTIVMFFLMILITTLATILAVQCFYFSESTRTWTASQNFCASHAATLAVFNTTKELDFLKRYSDHSQYWIGLSREAGQSWKWIDGTIYSGWFQIIGIGECAYLHKTGIRGSSTRLVRKWICSKSDLCIPRS